MLDIAGARTYPAGVRYFGGKNRIYQHIINLIPRHERFVEAFAGSAAVSRHLARGDAEAWAIELEPAQAGRLRKLLPGRRVVEGCAIAWLEEHAPGFGPETFIFADPPYPIEDRVSARARYACELDAAQHERLAAVLLATRARVLVCGHPWGAYLRLFAGWKRHEIPITWRSHRPGIEALWANYDSPLPLHDYRYVGNDKRVRQDRRRQVARHVAKFGAMKPDAREAVLRALVERFGTP